MHFAKYDLKYRGDYGVVDKGCTGCTTEFGAYPIFRGQYRYYYDMERRLEKGKQIGGNSGNYPGVLLAYQSATPLIGNQDASNTIVMGPIYGIQRTYKREFSIGGKAT